MRPPRKAVLYHTLIELCAAQGIKAVYGIVTSPNDPSQRLHEGLGFEVMGHQRHAGFTCGQWHDVTWYVKFLTDRFEDDPASPMPFPLLCDQQPQTVKDILDRANSSLR